MARRCCATRGGGSSPSGLPHSRSVAGRTGEGACLTTGGSGAPPSGLPHPTVPPVEPGGLSRRTNAVSRRTNKPPTYKSYRSYESYFFGDTRVLSHARQAHNQEPSPATPKPSLATPKPSLATPRGKIPVFLVFLEECQRINDMLWREILAYMAATPPATAKDCEGEEKT